MSIYCLYWDISEHLLFVQRYFWALIVCTKIFLSTYCLSWYSSEYLLFVLRYLWVITVCTEISLEYLLFLLRYLWVLTVWTEISPSTNKETMWKGKYESKDNTKNGKRKGKLLPKNEEISWGRAHTNTRKLVWDISTITDVFHDQCVFSCNYSLRIKKDICDHRNISLSFHEFVCAFPLEISSFFSKSFPFLFPFLKYIFEFTYVWTEIFLSTNKVHLHVYLMCVLRLL